MYMLYNFHVTIMLFVHVTHLLHIYYAYMLMHTLCIMLCIHIIMAEQQCCSCWPAQLCSRLLTGCSHAVYLYVVLISIIEKLS